MAHAEARFTERHGLMLLLGASLLAYAAVLVAYRVSLRDRTSESGPQPHVRWMRPGADRLAPSVYRMTDLMDPSLSALPNFHGFSRTVWSHQGAVGYRDPNWVVAPSFLEPRPLPPDPVLLEQEGPGRLVQQFSAKAAAEPETVSAQVTATVSVTNRTAFRVLGPLAEGAVIHAPELPALASDGPIRSTVVRIGVNYAGEVGSAILERSSGNTAADAQAINLARQFRFMTDPDLDTDALRWGSLRFAWAVKMAPAPGPASAPPAPPPGQP
jgi:TonB family protein